MSGKGAAGRPADAGRATQSQTGVEARTWLEQSARWVEPWLESALPADEGPQSLGAVMRYALLGGGKRLRPALVRLACVELGGDEDVARAPAVAVECIHAYSLVHDDLPCMDDDDLRRGRPSCHRAYGEALAVLAGDALQTTAFEVLAQAEPPVSVECARILARAAGSAGMVQGQVLDMTLANATADAVRAMHRLKTGALIAAAVEMGAVAAAVDEPQRARALAFGRSLGALFQAVDDILDVTGEARQLGKTPGKDERAEKASLARVLGLDGARQEARGLAEEAQGHAKALGFTEGGLALQLVDWFLSRSS